MASKANKKVSASVSNSGEGIKGKKVKEKVVDGAVGGCCMYSAIKWSPTDRF